MRGMTPPLTPSDGGGGYPKEAPNDRRADNAGVWTLEARFARGRTQ